MRLRRRRTLQFTMRTPEGGTLPVFVDLEAPPMAAAAYTDDELAAQLRQAGITGPAPEPRDVVLRLDELSIDARVRLQGRADREGRPLDQIVADLIARHA